MSHKFSYFSAYLVGIFIVSAGNYFVPLSLRAETRVATVDIARVLNESPEAKLKKADLDKAGAEAKKKIETKRKVLQEREAQLKEKKVSEDSPELKQFKEDAKAFGRYVKDTEEEFQQKFLKVNKTLTDKALEFVREYAKENNIDLVLDKSASDRGPVLFGQAQIDITPSIIAKINN
jgi:Skp family chaperone for outer membrane proteins